MLLVTKKNLKLVRKNFYTLTHFMQLKSALVNRELRTVSQDFIIVVFWFKFSVYVHYVSTLKCFLSSVELYYFIDCIFWTDQISMYKLDLLLMYHNHQLLSYVSYYQDSFCAMPVVIYWQVLYPLWWISGILNKWNEMKKVCVGDCRETTSPSIITFVINWNSTWATLTDREQYITCLNKECTIQECTHTSELEPWWSEHSWSGFVSFDISLSNFYAFFTCNKCHLIFV